MSRAYRSKAQWQGLIDDFEQSGLSRKAFCEARGINPDYFSQRRRQLQQEANGAGFAQVAAESPTTSAAAMQVRVGDAQSIYLYKQPVPLCQPSCPVGNFAIN